MYVVVLSKWYEAQLDVWMLQVYMNVSQHFKTGKGMDYEGHEAECEKDQGEKNR